MSLVELEQENAALRDVLGTLKGAFGRARMRMMRMEAACKAIGVWDRVEQLVGSDLGKFSLLVTLLLPRLHPPRAFWARMYVPIRGERAFKGGGVPSRRCWRPRPPRRPC